MKENERRQDVVHLIFIKLLTQDENNGCSWLKLLGPHGYQGTLNLCVDVKWLLPMAQDYLRSILDKSNFLLTAFPKVFYADNGQSLF